MHPLQIRLSNSDVRLAVPPRLSAITTYVLLEQETWFEKELSFLGRCLKPGMTAIDVGANFGVYALPMARLVGPRGRVIAYEPGLEARSLLQQSREINSAANLEIVGLALSDSEREGRLVAGSSSELSALGDVGDGEMVNITTLDIESAKNRWGSPDFIKIDAEGEEERIVAGGREFFGRNSPLVMFEIKAEGAIHAGLLTSFQDIGYRIFRLLVGAPILVPVEPGVAIDPFELNLFAAKPDRAKLLQDAGHLVDQVSTWEPSSYAISNGLSLLRRQAFARAFGRTLEDADRIDPDYAKALAAFAAWRTESLPARSRCAALFFAYRTLAALCNVSPTTARYSTFARLAWEGGWRGESVVALRQMAAYMQQNPFRPTEPCWPANPRFDEIPMADDPARWFATAVLEQLERAQSFSTFFSGASPWLGWLCEQPAVSLEMHRRRTLLEASKGMNPIVPSCLRKAASDHLNVRIWRSGKVPGARVEP